MQGGSNTRCDGLPGRQASVEVGDAEAGRISAPAAPSPRPRALLVVAARRCSTPWTVGGRNGPPAPCPVHAPRAPRPGRRSPGRPAAACEILRQPSGSSAGKLGIGGVVLAAVVAVERPAFPRADDPDRQVRLPDPPRSAASSLRKRAAGTPCAEPRRRRPPPAFRTWVACGHCRAELALRVPDHGPGSRAGSALPGKAAAQGRRFRCRARRGGHRR